MKEKTLENKIKKHLETNNHYYIKVHGSIFQKAGTPDVIACINGKFVAIEVKHPNGKGVVSELQKEVIKLIKLSQGKAIVIDSFEEYLEFYKEVK